MDKLNLEDIEFLKILSHSDTSLLEKGMTPEIRRKIDIRIGMILRQYYKENTMNLEPFWIRQFEKAGISEDEGKAAISCARRLGIEIS